MAEAHREPLALAQASWLQLHGLMSSYQAAILRGDTAEAERIRREAHDVLDSHLDLKGQAAVATRAIIGL